MADLERAKERIGLIAEGNRKNISLEDIEWVIFHLGLNGYATKVRHGGDHQKLFSIGSKRFGVCTHHRGSTHLKRVYEDQFIDVMIEVGLYE